MVPLTQDLAARKQPSQERSHAMSPPTIIGKNTPGFGLPEETVTLPCCFYGKDFFKGGAR